MSKLYKKLVHRFESVINNHRAVKANYDFEKIEKLILKQKKDKRFYESIQKFLDYLKLEIKNDNGFTFFLPAESDHRPKKIKLLLSLIIGNLKLSNESQHSSNFNTGSRWRALSTNAKMLFALLFLPLVTGRSIHNPCSTPFCTDPRTQEINVNEEYLSDLQESSKFRQYLLKKGSLKFIFSDTQFQLTPTYLKRYDETGKQEKSVSWYDYYWFVKALAIATVEKKIKLFNGNGDDAEKKTRGIFMMKERESEYKNMQLVNKDLLDETGMTVWEDFILHAFPGEKFKYFYPGQDMYSFFSILKATEAPSVFQTQITAQTSGPLQVGNNTVSSNDQKQEGGLNWVIPVSVAAISLFLFFIMIFFIRRCRKKSRAPVLDVKFSAPLINADSSKTGAKNNPSAGSVKSDPINTVDELISLWKKIKDALDKIDAKKGYVQLVNIKGGIDIYIEAIDLFLDIQNPNTTLRDLDIRYTLCLTFLTKLESILQGKISKDFSNLSEKIKSMSKALASKPGADPTGPIGIRNLRDNFLAACKAILEKNIFNVQDSDNSREQVKEVFSFLITDIGVILFDEGVWGKFESNKEEMTNKNSIKITGPLKLLKDKMEMISKLIINIKDGSLRQSVDALLGPLKANISSVYTSKVEKAGFLQGKAKANLNANVPSTNFLGNPHRKINEPNTASHELIYANLSNPRT